VLLQHGTNDPMIPTAGTRGLAEALIEAGLPVVYGEYPMGHEVSNESLSDITGWLSAKLDAAL